MDQFIFHARKKHSWATRYARDLHKHRLSNCHSPRWLLLCFHSMGEKLRLGEAKWPSRLTARRCKAAGGPAGCVGAALSATRKFSLFCHGFGKLGLHRNPNLWAAALTILLCPGLFLILPAEEDSSRKPRAREGASIPMHHKRTQTGTRGVHDSCSYRSCSPLYFSSAFHCDLRYFSNIIGTFCFLSL